MVDSIKESIKDIIKRLKIDSGKWEHSYINCYNTKINELKKEKET